MYYWESRSLESQVIGIPSHHFETNRGTEVVLSRNFWSGNITLLFYERFSYYFNSFILSRENHQIHNCSYRLNDDTFGVEINAPICKVYFTKSIKTTCSWSLHSWLGYYLTYYYLRNCGIRWYNDKKELDPSSFQQIASIKLIRVIR